MYKDRVAIQLPNRVVIYQLEAGAGELDMQYHSAAKIAKKLECNLLVVTSQHIVLCQVRCVVLCVGVVRGVVLSAGCRHLPCLSPLDVVLA